MDAYRVHIGYSGKNMPDKTSLLPLLRIYRLRISCHHLFVSLSPVAGIDFSGNTRRDRAGGVQKYRSTIPDWA